MPVDEARSLVALVLRDPWLTAGSIADNVVFGHPDVNRSDIESVCEQLGLDEFIAALPNGYDTLVEATTGLDDERSGRPQRSHTGPGPDPYGAEPVRLTVGQSRRLALARALVRNPGLLLLEEPTTGLDPDDERLMIRAIDAASHGRTTVLTTHRLSLARRCDAVHVIEDGKIVAYRGGATGHHHAELWDLQVPPVVIPTGQARSHLRVVGTEERRAPRPTSSSWGITIGSEVAPGYLASGLLSRNALTETWVAWSIEREEPVRVRIPREDPVSYAAFEQLFRQYKMFDKLSHPSLISVFGADLDAETPYLVLEYLDSNSLARVAERRQSGMDPVDILFTGFELAGAVIHMHQRGFVHLGLKAKNIRTRDDTIVITDFAQSRAIGNPLPQPAGPVKARRLEHRSFAPEWQPGRPADPKMDVYALGALMHRATAGAIRTRVTSRGVGLVPYRTLTDRSPGAMADVVDAMVARDPAERPALDEVLSEFRRILPRSMIGLPVSTVTNRSPKLRLVGADN
jgi:energy-coupling factor transporter ATP-binding protein EcfA2